MRSEVVSEEDEKEKGTGERWNPASRSACDSRKEKSCKVAGDLLDLDDSIASPDSCNVL